MSLNDEALNELRKIVHGPDGALTGALPEEPTAWLDLIVRARQARDETAVILAEAVMAARAADVSWEAIGSALGISRQAAQQRFGRSPRQAEDGEPGRRRMTGLTAFNEMSELNRVGRYGWHSVANGPFFHDVVQDVVQWEHQRTSFLVDTARMAREGWQAAGRPWFPWLYWARPTGEPALDGAATTP